MKVIIQKCLKKQDFIRKIVKSEEESFARTASFRSNTLQKYCKGTKQRTVCYFRADVFKLYDTYGFQLELTQKSLEVGMTVDREGFESAEQQRRARASVVKGDFLWACKMKLLQNITAESHN